MFEIQKLMAVARNGGVVCTLAFFAFATFMQAQATPASDQAVNIGGALALLNQPESPKAGLILVPGGNGRLGIRRDGSFSRLGGNQLVRTRKDYLKYGIATLTVDWNVSIPAAVAYMQKFTASVVLVATSRGSLRVPAGLAAKPDGIVLTAALLSEFSGLVGSSTSLPHTLVVHHRQDGCKVTPPAAVERFEAWGSGKVTVVWITGGIDSGDPCRAHSYHGFNGRDDLVVSTIAQYANSRR
jgi:hypothetical protein